MAFTEVGDTAHRNRHRRVYWEWIEDLVFFVELLMTRVRTKYTNWIEGFRLDSCLDSSEYASQWLLLLLVACQSKRGKRPCCWWATWDKLEYEINCVERYYSKIVRPKSLLWSYEGPTRSLPSSVHKLRYTDHWQSSRGSLSRESFGLMFKTDTEWWKKTS